MKENNLYLEFNDNGTPIDFNLNHNIVFYGNNGKGKTRILKTVHTIYELAKKKNLTIIPKLIDEMNLKELKINGISHRDLLITNQEYRSSELRNTNQFIRSHLDQFKYLYTILKDIEFEVSTPKISQRSFFNYLHRLIINEGINTHNVNGFNRWLRDLDYLVKKISEDRFWANESNNEVLNEFEEIKQLTAFLIDKYNFISYEFNKMFWQDKIDYEQIIKFENLILERKKIENKILKFNEIMKNYAPIEIDIFNNDLLFKKAKLEIEFNKLSSGERKITFLFLSIILNDVDIYLIDEPELSLSLNYQNRIVTDLEFLTEGGILLLATHAPYIYEDFIANEKNKSKEV